MDKFKKIENFEIDIMHTAFALDRDRFKLYLATDDEGVGKESKIYLGYIAGHDIEIVFRARPFEEVEISTQSIDDVIKRTKELETKKNKG